MSLPVITLKIPMPPSTNTLFVYTGTKRVKTKKYRAWLDAAGWEVLSQRPPRVTGPVSVELMLQRENAASDIDNRLKATLDLLVKQQVIEDDRFVMRVSAEWVESGGCTVSIRPYVAAGEIAA